jgi:hypothetical protein
VHQEARNDLVSLGDYVPIPDFWKLWSLPGRCLPTHPHSEPLRNAQTQLPLSFHAPKGEASTPG